MARARNIKPALFTNDKLADVEMAGRLLFIGLWTIADREGRLEDRPRRIKIEVLPYDNVDVDNLLNQLAETGFIVRYSVGGERFIQVTNFAKHQNPHMKESASVIPAPDLTGASTVQAPDLTGTSPADSLNLIPDTGYLIPDTPTTRERDSSATPPDDVSDAKFDEFWKAYPKKTGKQPAAKAFKRINWRKVYFADVMAALEKQKASAQWTKDDGQYVPNAATWLNNDRWTDELKPAAQTSSPQSPGQMTTAQRLALQAKREREEYEQARGNGSSGDAGHGVAGEADNGRNEPSLFLVPGRRTG